MNEQGLLYRYLPAELPPPKQVWEQILRVLDESERGALGRMENLEIPPPKSAWENIVSVLDERHILPNPGSFAETCLAMEVPPPPFAWNNIEKALDTETPVRRIDGKARTIRRIVTGVAVAACLTGVVFTVINRFGNRPDVKNSGQLATVEKNKPVAQQKTVSPASETPDHQQAQTNPPISSNDTQELAKLETAAPDGSILERERELTLEKYKPVPVPNINTTNNQVASHTGKLRDAYGNIIDRIGDHTTFQGYLAAIGPNGNSVNVSTKLVNMIEFFQEDSSASRPEEYLDKVMRESNVWRQKFIDWRKKVDAADANPSQMNFLDPIDLIRFFQQNK